MGKIKEAEKNNLTNDENNKVININLDEGNRSQEESIIKEDIGQKDNEIKEENLKEEENVKRGKKEKRLKTRDNIINKDIGQKDNEIKENNLEQEKNLIKEKNKEQEEIDIKQEDIRQENNEKQENNIELNENVVQEEINKGKDGLKKYTIVITIISVILFIGLIVFSTIFGLINRTSDKIVSGISINGIDISGLTYEEATQKIGKIYEEKTKKNISLKHNDYETSISPEQIETKFNVKEAIYIAYGVGRSGKILKDNYAIINAYIMKIDIKPASSYNEKALSDFISQTSENLPDAVKQSSYYVEENNLIIDKGKKGVVIKKEELKENIINSIVNSKLNIEEVKQKNETTQTQETSEENKKKEETENNYKEEIQGENENRSENKEQMEEKNIEVINIPVEEKEPDAINIEKIHAEIYKEAKDAYYTKNPFTIYPHIEGVDFNISMDEAKALVNNNENQITIPLKTSMPNITTNQIGTEAFPDLLATYSTTFSTKNGNRTTNIRLSSNKINGVVLMPGEEFSYNKVVGKRTAAAGYKTAAVYVGGKVENGIGGGICQVSSTLYNTALRANLEIVKRSNHRFATGYVPLSTDATVSWGGPEFIFKNSRKYPIKIVSTVTGGKVKVDIYGCKENVEYEVVIQSQTLQTIPMKTEVRINPSLPAGTTKTVQKGHGGYKSRAYRILKLNGSVVSKQLLSTDTYAQLPTIIEKN